jgi:signal transduction histidine kinase
MPIWLRMAGDGATVSGDVRHVVILARRLSIAGILFLGYLYYKLSGGGTALSTIGLVSFTGVAQILPVLLGGIFWRGATRSGALAGICTGFGIWLYTSFLPSFGLGQFMSGDLMQYGPLGITWLRPDALFGIEGIDPLLHALFWSISLNSFVFVAVSLASFPSPLERLQGAQFVNVFQHSLGARGWSAGVAQSEDLMIMAQRILGAKEAQSLFTRAAAAQGRIGQLPEPSPDFLQSLERELAGSVGAATAHAMIGQIVGGAAVSVEDLMAVADETAQMMEYSSRLEVQSEELSRTARQLREANEKLTRLSVQKDAFLSQISHELRTPMTSIRSFSEILRDSEQLLPEEQTKYASIIHDEAIRLTRLLDDLLDLSVLENGQVNLNLRAGSLGDVLERAIAAAAADESGAKMVLRRDAARESVMLYTDLDRLSQVFINLISNARKYCDADQPELEIRVHEDGGLVVLDFVDNGTGIAPEAQDVIFEKFARVSDQKAGGAGLGLAICRQIITRLGGEIDYLSGERGAAFRVTLPTGLAKAAE